MELLCALLTGFFLWLLVYQWRRKSIARWRQVAGSLICVAKSTRPRRVRWAFFIYFSLILIAHICSAVVGNHLTFDSQLGVALVFTIVLLLGIPARRHIALEVRERGVFCGRVGDRISTGRLHFVPWNQIATCQWVVKSYGVASRFDDARNCLTIADNSVPPDQKSAVTAALGRFAIVYDHDGTRLAEPDEEHRNANWVSWRDLDRPRFQFDLQTLLLLAVVVACAANLFGLHYRSPEYQAIVKLKAFDPEIRCWPNDEVLDLDFSRCTNKPTDDDLANLEPFSELLRLDLAGAPITDAGLTHLKGLKKLQYVNLANTGVSAEGIEDLKRALPHAGIAKYVRWVPPSAVPLAPSPPKGKWRP
jgi:hypothetical protein